MRPPCPWPLVLVALCVSTGAWAGAPGQPDQPKPDQEVIPSLEAFDTQVVVKTTEAAILGLYAKGLRPSRRDAHAKAHGCVKADFTVDANIPETLRRGVFAEPQTYKAWVRLSNSAGTPHNDFEGDGRGLAIKLMGVPGTKVLPEEATAQTQDFLMINLPTFFIRNVADYAKFVPSVLLGTSQSFFKAHPHEGATFNAMNSHVSDMLKQRFYSMAPYLLGATYIKFSARPVDCATGAALTDSGATPPKDQPDFLSKRLVAWLAEKDACFKFGVQPQTDPKTQPIEDPTIVWKESEAPFIDVATLHIPKQDFDSPAQQTFCENLSYTPWHALPDERPVGGINRMRKAVYQAISKERHSLNKAPRAEPTGWDIFNG